MDKIKAKDRLVFKDDYHKELFAEADWLNSYIIRDCVRENTCTVHAVNGGLLEVSYIEHKPDWCALHTISVQDLKYFYKENSV